MFPQAARPITGLPAGQKASDVFAALTRQQWQDYVAQFIPFENDLIEYAMNPETVTKSIDRARAGVAASFKAQEGVNERRLRANQVTLSPDEQAAAGRRTDLARSLADVQSANIARDMTVQRQRAVMGSQPAPIIQQGGQ